MEFLFGKITEVTWQKLNPRRVRVLSGSLLLPSLSLVWRHSPVKSGKRQTCLAGMAAIAKPEPLTHVLANAGEGMRSQTLEI